MEILRNHPSVFAVGREYQIMVPVTEEVTMWVEVGGKCYYDETNGILRSKNMIHRVSVPCDELDGAGEYTLYYRRMLNRRPYYTESGDAVGTKYTFRPIVGDVFHAYHISDTHGMVKQPIAAARFYEESHGKIDLLIEIRAVEEIFVHPFLTATVKIVIECLALGLPEGVRHFCTATECDEIVTLKPRGGTEELDVQRIVLTPVDHAVAVKIPAVGIFL